VALSDRLTEAHAKARQEHIAAPVFGRPEAAGNAKLLVVAGGAKRSVERCRPILEALGPKVLVIGAEILGESNSARVPEGRLNFLRVRDFTHPSSPAYRAESRRRLLLQWLNENPL
jgi:hypothetical protein